MEYCRKNNIRRADACYLASIGSSLLIVFLLCLSLSSNAQNTDTASIIVEATIVNGDTIPILSLPVVNIQAGKEFGSEKEKMKYSKLVRDVKKAYPYAKLAGVIILRYNDTISRITDKKKRQEYLAKAEESLKAKFKDDITKMTFTQGRILIKLIDRETGNSSFEIIKQLRGGFQAFLWQSIARMFGNNLKDKYDKTGNDKAIEEIIQEIDAGNL